MIDVVLELRDYDNWPVEGFQHGAERKFLVMPRKGEHIKYKGTRYKVREVTYDLGDGLAPLIHILAKSGD